MTTAYTIYVSYYPPYCRRCMNTGVSHPVYDGEMVGFVDIDCPVCNTRWRP